MHQLPTVLLLTVLASVDLVVSSNVLVQCAEHDHGDHGREEEHDHQRVEDAEPLDIGVRHRVKDVIPTGRPADVVVFREGDGVSVGDVQGLGQSGMDRHGRGDGGTAVGSSTVLQTPR